MTTVGKILAAFVAVASMAFLGFAGVTTLGGPNWQATADSLDEYTFSYEDGENPQWTVTNTLTGENVKTSPVLPDVIQAALDDDIARQKSQIDQLALREQELTERLDRMEKANAADEAALEARAETLRSYLADLREQYRQLSQQVVELTEQAQAVEQQVEIRRGDVERLKAQLVELRADRARVQEIQQQMQDLIEQINGNLQRADRRQEQLQQRLQEDSYSPAPVTEVETSG